MKPQGLAKSVCTAGMLLAGACLVLAQTPPARFRALHWRAIGPYRGGRATAVAGVDSQPFVYYMGATGGGVWKTTDGGITWKPISDGWFKTGSVGSIAVDQGNPSILYAGMGEACLRANLSHGDGMYKSSDAGKTWMHIGLEDSSQIGKVLIDPRDANTVYVAAVGHPYGPNAERGVFRTRDGGQSWQKILFLNDQTGAADLAMDPKDPNTIYATLWQVLRTPWGIDESGPGSGIYKTTDGGDHWTHLTEGLPKTDLAKIGITVSSVNPSRLWASVGGPEGGVYRSDDAGHTWQLMNGAFFLHTRQYYYGHIFADPQQADTVYTFSSKNFYKSTDGGRTWTTIRTPHGDYHDLWIDPRDDQRMVNANDGGATVTFNGGESWSSEMNQPTGQFYTVKTDNGFPYRVYGAQQDNTTVSIPSQSDGFGIGVTDWYEVGGGESGYVVPDPRNAEVTYAGSYWGMLTRYEHSANLVRNIAVLPDYPGGRTAAQMKYRFQWTFPIAISPADPGAIYAGGNVVFKSTDQGQSWQAISPDLTRNDKTRESGGRLEEIYCTVFTVAPSPIDKNVIWTGSDDGLIYVTRDGGAKWSNVTPPAIAPWTRINIIDASPKDPAAAYAAITRYQLDDFRPYIYKTDDFGKTWTLAVSGIPENTFVRTVREDPARRGLLFAGTEAGVYVSFDDGAEWQSLQLNLPIVPVTDLAIKGGDLVASTQGRGFWILDDITSLEQAAPASDSAAHLFPPRPAYRLRRGGFFTGGSGLAPNPPAGVIIDYSLAATPSGVVRLTFSDAAGSVIKTFTSAAQPESGPGGRRPAFLGRFGAPARVTVAPGLNRFVWDLRYPDARGIQSGTYLSGGNLRGPEAVPGTYQVKLEVDGQPYTQSFEILKDPRWTATQDDLQKQFSLLIRIRDDVSAADDAINSIRRVRHEIAAAAEKEGGGSPIVDSAKKLDGALGAALDTLFEPRFTGYDDQMLLFPLKLNNRIAALQGYVQGAYPPTDQDEQVFAELHGDLERTLETLHETYATDLPAFNKQLEAAGMPPISTSPAGSTAHPR